VHVFLNVKVDNVDPMGAGAGVVSVILEFPIVMTMEFVLQSVFPTATANNAEMMDAVLPVANVLPVGFVIRMAFALTLACRIVTVTIAVMMVVVALVELVLRDSYATHLVAVKPCACPTVQVVTVARMAAEVPVVLALQDSIVTILLDSVIMLAVIRFVILQLKMLATVLKIVLVAVTLSVTILKTSRLALLIVPTFVEIISVKREKQSFLVLPIVQTNVETVFANLLLEKMFRHALPIVLESVAIRFVNKASQ